MGRLSSFQAGQTPRLREVDLRECSAFEREEAAFRLAEHERCEEFPLGAPPLIRLLLIRVGEREQRVVVTSHRAVLDDWSHAALVRAMLSAHGWDVSGGRRQDGGRAPLVAVAGEESGRDAAVRAWRQEFEDWAGSPVLDGFGAGSGEGSNSGSPDDGPAERLTRELPGDLVRQLLDRLAEYGVDPETVVQGAWAVALSELTGRRDVVFGGVLPCPTTGLRIGAEPRHVLPIPVSVQPDQSVIELLLAIDVRNARLGPHCNLGLAELREVVGSQASFGTVALLGPEPIEPVSPRLGMHIRTLSTFDAKPYALSFSVTPAARWTVRLDYRVGALSERNAVGALDSAVAAIEAMAYAPGIALSQLPTVVFSRVSTFTRAA